MPDYRSQANILMAERLKNSNASTNELAKALMHNQGQQQVQSMQGDQKMAQMAETEAAGTRETDRNLGVAKELLKTDPGYNVNLSGQGGVALSKQKPEVNPLAMLGVQMRKEKVLDDQINRYSNEYNKANLPQATQTLKDVENNIPGGLSGEGKFKSIGGAKNLIPGFAVGGLESLGILDKGAARERSALQNMANVQIYDASGKAVNEGEMARLKEGMGWSPFTDPNTLRDSLRRFGYTVEQRGKTIEAGTNPEALQTAQARGIEPISGIGQLLHKGTKKTTQNGGSDGRTVVKQMINKKTGQTKVVYDDGSEEIR